MAVTCGGKRVDGLEVTISASNIATSRFANNGMTQNQSPYSESVSVRVLLEGRQARLSTDQTSKSAIEQLIDDAIAAAKLLDKDPELLELPMPYSIDHLDPNRFDQATADIDPNRRAQAVQKMIEAVSEFGLTAAGTYSSGESVKAIGNTNGLFVLHKETSTEASITVREGDASGWAKIQSPKAGDIDPSLLAKQAAEKAKMGRHPREVPPGQYTVILEPAAVLDLLGYLWYEFTGTSHSDKLSSLLNKLGEKVFGDNITISDDYAHPMQAGPPFDGEGSERKAVNIIERGIFKNMIHSRRSAKRFGVNPTGHGLPEPSVLGEYSENIVIAGGDSSLAQMISSTDYGILVTRVWYVREVDPQTLLLTGLTQDGTFLIENGKLKAGVNNMRFNISIHEMLNKVLTLGPAVRAAGEEATPAVVPSMKIADFNFTEQSLF